MEIERKFTVKKIPDNLENFECINMEQCYISTSPTIRLRRENDNFVLTVKGSGLVSREEFELLITKEQYEKLLNKRETPFVKKKRYKIPIKNGLIAELDIYEGELLGLLTVEVEFESEKEAIEFIPPEWFDKDVTMDGRYKNTSLSLYGIPK